MSDAKQEKPTVPDGYCRFIHTRQLPPTEAGFVGYETIWETFQKEQPYETPKAP